ESNRVGTIRNRSISLFRRRCSRTINQVKLVTEVLTSNIVTDLSAIRKTKRPSILLGNRNTSRRTTNTVRALKSVRPCKSLDRTTKLLSRENVCIDDVIGVMLG